MILRPETKFVIVRQLDDPQDASTLYVQAVIRDSLTDDVLDTVNLTDQGSQRFTKDWQVPADKTGGEGQVIDIETLVYTDSNYSTLSNVYGAESIVHMIQDTPVPPFGFGGGGESVDYDKIRKSFETVIRKQKQPKAPRVSLAPVLRAIGNLEQAVLARANEPEEAEEKITEDGIATKVVTKMGERDQDVIAALRELTEEIQTIESNNDKRFESFTTTFRELMGRFRVDQERFAVRVQNLRGEIRTIVTQAAQSALRGFRPVNQTTLEPVNDIEEPQLPPTRRRPINRGFVALPVLAFVSALFIGGAVVHGILQKNAEDANLGATQRSLPQWTASSTLSGLYPRNAQDVYVNNFEILGTCVGCGGGAAASSTIVHLDGSQVNTGVPTLDFDGTDFTIVESPTDDFDITVADELALDLVDFNGTTSVAHTAGRRFYDSVKGRFISYVRDADVTLEDGFENLVDVRNETGSTITDGTPVYVTNATSSENGLGSILSVAPASASAENTARVVGIVTSGDIANDAEGYVTQFGNINGIDTSGFTQGDLLYLATTSGELTNVAPTEPNETVVLGYALDSTASGRIFITTIGNTGGENIITNAQQLTIPARKDTAGTITRGQVVALTAYNTGLDIVEVELADADDSTSPYLYPAIGIALDTITNSQTGDILVAGVIENIDTSAAAAVNDVLYLSTTAGGLSASKPSGIDDCVQGVGRVARVSATVGVLEVQGAGRCNDSANKISVVTATTTNLVINSELFTDLTGTGLTLSGTSLASVLGTDISESELSINAPTNGYLMMASSSATGGWEWVATSSPSLNLHSPVTLAGTPNYLTISGQQITQTALDLADDLNAFSSADLRGRLSDEVGTGAAYFVGGALGTPASGNGSNLTALNATQLTTGTIPAARVGTSHIDTITEIASGLKDGTGACSSGLLCLGGHTHAISTEISGLGTGVATFLGTPSSANLASAITNETGSGALVFGTGPTIAGLTGTGVWDLGGASSFELPNGTNLTLDANGEIGINTGTSSVRFYDGTAKRQIKDEWAWGTSFASSSLDYDGDYGAAGTTTAERPGFKYNVTMTEYYCETDTGTVTLRVGDGTNWGETLTCTTSGDIVTGPANASFSARETIQIQVGQQTSNPNRILFDATARWTID